MSKLKNVTYASVAGITALSVSSCSKYEDGPSFSLKTKKARVVGSWDVKSIGNTATQPGYSVNMNFEKNGVATYSYTYSGGSSTYAGSWNFASDKENLLLTIDGSTQLFEIKRLTNKEMWLDDDITTVDGDIWKLEAK
ncbi:MAG: lipocalin family protein [Flavobacteriales bacterium]